MAGLSREGFRWVAGLGQRGDQGKGQEEDWRTSSPSSHSAAVAPVSRGWAQLLTQGAVTWRTGSHHHSGLAWLSLHHDTSRLLILFSPLISRTDTAAHPMKRLRLNSLDCHMAGMAFLMLKYFSRLKLFVCQKKGM